MLWVDVHGSRVVLEILQAAESLRLTGQPREDNQGDEGCTCLGDPGLLTTFFTQQLGGTLVSDSPQK